jgi:Cu/Ag efflux pump CusA
LTGAFVASALLVFLLLYVAFHSVWQALLITATIPMAIALIGGLITSTILTLVALPALYGVSEGMREGTSRAWLRWRRRGSEAEATASPGD